MILIKEHTVNKIISNKKGISLIEIVAALAIFTVLFISVSSLIMSAMKSENSTNNSIKSTSIIQGVRDTLYNKDNTFFKNYLNGKDVRFELNNVYSIQRMLIDDIQNGSEMLKGDSYISDSDKNNPIKYIVYINTKSQTEGLYNVTLSIIPLNKSQYYYYENGQRVPSGDDITLNTKGIQVMSQQMIIRPISDDGNNIDK
ncbi:PulJ/GspJ family protein [Clostridium sardiniense]|uniref:PulJ/GspJ family protein n=1 Tax=Clostridium sardiniense TaxID=29369 RepID=UPI00195D1C09|nr:prepilin-type N-terminal cleavage/methylation domain-containing protein [Clostridium sardiniense]MBM7834447.1 Tfp pilus assembly protein PilV [Clostridium sardiniense]